MRISIFKGGYTTEFADEVIESWDEFVDLVTVPHVGQKNGDYFVRGFCDGKRLDANMAGVDLIIIDGDQLLKNGTTCCQPQPVHECLKRHNITHVVYNSYSNDVINNKHKWRACIPTADVVDSDTLAQGCAEIITLLHKDGLDVRNVKENMVLSQPWYTPRCPDHTFDDFWFGYHDGESYHLTGHVIDSAMFDAGYTVSSNGKGGCFSWDYVIGQFQAGTLHLGLKSACGWLIYTTDWADKQIKQHLAALVIAICPDKEKVARACGGKEIDDLIKYCRQKSGKNDISIIGGGWKDHLITAAELKDKEFPPIQWAVDGVIPEGLTVLAGDPKSGKSLMAVDICSAVACGGRAFGERECVQGGAVYLSMEDPPRRVKERIRVQRDLWPDTFRMIDGGIPTIGKLFFDTLDEMMLMYPDTRVMVIDTLQFVVPPKKVGTNDYDHYYSILDPLHRWALDNHVAVVVITHKNKSKGVEGDNPFAGIIGSVAIQGTADAMIMLCKNHAKGGIIDGSIPDGFLEITGREISGERMALEFDSEAMLWSLKDWKKPEIDGVNVNWLTIMDSLRVAKKTPVALSDATKINRSTVRSCLKRMADKKIVEKDEDGVWAVCGFDYHDGAEKW